MLKYRIIGADGHEYGPVTADQVRQWIAQGRANGQTRIRFEGSAEWKLLSDLPEFRDALGGPATAATPPPRRLSESEARAIANNIIARDYQLRIGHCIGCGWNLVMSHFGLTAGATFLIFLLTSAIAPIPFATLLLKSVMAGGLQWMFLKLVRGQRAELGDAFAGFTLAFVPLMLLSLVSQLLGTLGLLFCILPGVYLLVAWVFAALLVLDKNLDFWPAMELSRKVVTHHWWQVFGLCLLNLLLLCAGSLVLCVGFFIALPVVAAATVYAYNDIFGSGATGTPAADLVPVGPLPIRPTTPVPLANPAPQNEPAPGASAPNAPATQAAVSEPANPSSTEGTTPTSPAGPASSESSSPPPPSPEPPTRPSNLVP